MSVLPMTVSRPLASAKLIGTTILFLSGVRDPADGPSSLPAQDNLLVWLKADAGVRLSPTNVVSWTDQSRNGFIFASRSEGARPTLTTNAGNGLIALHFDPAKRNQLNGTLGTTLSNATIFSLMRLNAQSSTRYMYAFGTRNTSGFMMTLARRGGDDAYHYDGAAEWANPGTWGDTNFVVLSQVYGGGGPDHHLLDLNGRTVIDSRTTTGRPYSAVTDNVVIGNYLSATYNISGDFAEWIVYDRALGEAEQSQVEEYLRRRAGLPPFPAVTNVSVSSVGFSVGAADRATASWTYDSTNDVFYANGGAAPSINVLDQGFSGEEVHTRVSATGIDGAIGVLLGYRDRGNFFLLDWRALSKTNKDRRPWFRSMGGCGNRGWFILAKRLRGKPRRILPGAADFLPMIRFEVAYHQSSGGADAANGLKQGASKAQWLQLQSGKQEKPNHANWRQTELASKEFQLEAWI